MPETPQEVDANTQPRSRKMLQDLKMRLSDEKFGYLTDDLPSYEHLKIFQDDQKDVLIQFGNKEESRKEPIFFSVTGRTNWTDIKKNKHGWQNVIEFINEYAEGDKTPFDWSAYLYKGLFIGPPEMEISDAESSGTEHVMLGPSHALLNYYFLLWAANSRQARNVRLPETFMFDRNKRRSLVNALSELHLTGGFKNYRRNKQETRFITPSIDIASRPGKTIPGGMLIGTLEEGLQIHPQPPPKRVRSETYAASKDATKYSLYF